MQAYTINYKHSRGVYTATKWAENATDALAAVKRTHKRVHLSAAVGAISYDKAELINPQPFTEEARFARGLPMVCAVPGEKPITGEMDIFPSEEPEQVGDDVPEIGDDNNRDEAA